MRILHHLEELQPGGAEAVCLTLCSWLVDRGHDVVVVARDGAFRSRLPAGVTWVPVTGDSPASDLTALNEAVRKHRPQILHAHQRREALLCAVTGRRYGIPVVEHAHTVLPSRRLKALSFRSSRVFAVGDAVRDMVVEDFGRKSERVITVGNTASSVSTTAPAPVVLHEPVRIVGIGRLEEQKNPVLFVDIIAELSERRAVEATWYGVGPLRDEVLERARQRGVSVVLPGLSDDVTGVLDEADLLLMTSRWEGRPLVVLEAMTRLRPVCAPDIPGIDELLEGSRGLLYGPHEDAVEISRELEALVSDEERLLSMADRAHQYIEDHASPDVVFAPIETSYRDLVS